MRTMRLCCSVLLGHVLAVSTSVAAAAVPAFPGAEGWGAESVGGRGGKVIAVTNLQDSGPGSLRAALESSGPRIVVFRVAGTIHLQSTISLEGRPYVTIAGQTAPGAGITIRGARIRADAHDIVMRFMTIRPGLDAQKDSDGVKFTNGAERVVLDHNSISWSRDENLDIYCGSSTCKDFTFSWNLLAEGLKGHSCGMIAGGAYGTSVTQTVHVDLIRNLVIHAENRMPFLKIRSARLINNLFSHGEWMMTMIRGGIDVDIVGNAYRRLSSGGGSNSPYEIIAWGNNCTGIPATGDGGACGNPSIFIEGNSGPHAGPSEDNWPMIEWGSPNSNQQPPSSCRRDTPQPDSPIGVKIRTLPAAEAEITADVGNSRRLDEHGKWVPRRDAIDERLVKEYGNDTGIVPASPDDVGGYLQIPAAPPYADEDEDGMADIWEAEQGLDPSDPKDGNLDCDGNGYTNIEEFLNGSQACAGPLSPIEAGPAGSAGSGGQPADSGAEENESDCAVSRDAANGGSDINPGSAGGDVDGGGDCRCTLRQVPSDEENGLSCSVNSGPRGAALTGWALLIGGLIAVRKLAGSRPRCS